MDNQTPIAPQEQQPAAPARPAPSHPSKIPVIVTAVLIAVAVLAGFYLYGLSLSLEEAQQAAEQTRKPAAQADIQADAAVDSIAKDLNTIDVESSDDDMDGVDREF